MSVTARSVHGQVTSILDRLDALGSTWQWAGVQADVSHACELAFDPWVRDEVEQEVEQDGEEVAVVFGRSCKFTEEGVGIGDRVAGLFVLVFEDAAKVVLGQVRSMWSKAIPNGSTMRLPEAIGFKELVSLVIKSRNEHRRTHNGWGGLFSLGDCSTDMVDAVVDHVQRKYRKFACD